MLPNINPTTTRAWEKLQAHLGEMRSVHMRDLFRQEPGRFDSFSIKLEELLFDFSKNIITQKTLDLLLELAEECKLRESIEALYNGEAINVTEKRAVLHMALRNFSDTPFYDRGSDVMPEVKRVLKQMEEFCTAVHDGKLRGFTGKRIKYVVNIGIGGSDLGPRMVTEALRPYQKKKIRTFFVSNVDAGDIIETLKEVEPDRTLFIICSKTFTTQETMANAAAARQWFLKKARSDIYIRNHFVAVSTNRKAAIDFGVDPANVFEFWDWVGGRFSLWSAIGLSIALATGYKNFEDLLRGAHAADNHFYHTEFRKNIPVMMALLGIWYRNFFGSQTEAVLPYDHYLRHLPEYYQQASMESNGKSIDRNGQAVEYSTGAVAWGAAGTNGQHAFYQLIHQGTPLIPCDFIAAAQSPVSIGNHHRLLLSNFLAQTEALMNGKTELEAEEELEKLELNKDEIARLLPFKVFSGNRPSNSILVKKMTPYQLGQLIALYEHKIFVQGIIWNIFSFDQWGVELGKQLAGAILPELEKNGSVTSHDSSTNGLINAWKAPQK